MKRILMGLLLVTGLAVGFVGCSEKSKVQETKTVQTPEGTTKETTTHETTKSGENPPAAPSKEP